MHSDLKSKLSIAQEEGLSYVAWRLPNEGVLNQMGPSKECVWMGEEGESEAFVFAPFSSKHPAYCLGSFDAQNSEIQTLEIPIVQDSEHYQELVKKAVAEIQSGKLDKVVGARVIEEETQDFDPIAHFIALMKIHTNAFCYLWYSPSTGLWMGASPEILLERKGSQLRTMALAGTRADILDDFGIKELEEQDLVLHYLEETLRPFVTHLEVAEKTKAHSGHLVHLKNEVKGYLKEELSSIYPLIKALHPTPAIAGLPKKEALEFIAQEEDFDRSYYSGFLGMHSSSESQLFVNLRCMQVIANKQYLYVGAGLTAMSEPEAEWLETQEKARVVRLR